MKVYVVETGENHEGGSVVSIHESKDGAFAAAMAVEPYEGWKEDKRTEWATPVIGSWSAACDWLTVTEMEVKP